MLSRRDFLRYGLTAVGGFSLLPWLAALGEGAERVTPWTPPIYKRFLQFTEYEERPGTECIVIHHSGAAKDLDTTAAAVHKYHQGYNGWAGIGYHYLIRKDGMIEQGRRPPMIGAHAYEHNRKSVGICLAGNFELANPTPEQLAAVKELTAWLCLKYRLDPKGKGVIVGHRDLNDTLCPGKNLYKRLGEIREDAARIKAR